MEYLKLFEDYYQDLYHFTTLQNLVGILVSGEIKQSSYYGNISLTRHKNFFDVKRGGNMQSGSSHVRITIDAEKLRQKYKVIPFNYFKTSYTKHLSHYESEEIVKGNIPLKYVKKIEIFKDKLTHKKNIFIHKEHTKYIDELLNIYGIDLLPYLDSRNEYYFLLTDYEMLDIISKISEKLNMKINLI